MFVYLFNLLYLCMWLQVINKVKVTHQSHCHTSRSWSNQSQGQIKVILKEICSYAGGSHLNRMRSCYSWIWIAGLSWSHQEHFSSATSFSLSLQPYLLSFTAEEETFFQLNKISILSQVSTEALIGWYTTLVQSLTFAKTITFKQIITKCSLRHVRSFVLDFLDVLRTQWQLCEVEVNYMWGLWDALSFVH